MNICRFQTGEILKWNSVALLSHPTYIGHIYGSNEVSMPSRVLSEYRNELLEAESLTSVDRTQSVWLRLQEFNHSFYL